MTEQLTVFEPGERAATINDLGEVQIWVVTDLGNWRPAGWNAVSP